MVKKEEVEKIAGLAKLEFSESELNDLTGELNHILGYIDQLSELDVKNIAPLENMNEGVEQAVLRKDEVRPSLAVADALKNAPKAADNYFLVPKVLEQEKKAYVEQDIVGDEEEELL
jgi:aspartyl-tRNA(Asn)/glutamyl-tRNA(Gln) amidotransferase subunit C